MMNEIESVANDAATTHAAVLAWLFGDDVGASSKCIAAHLTGHRSDGSHPSDPDDLGRCLRLLNRIPALCEAFPKMAEVSPYWAALVPRWDELALVAVSEIAIYNPRVRGSAPETYRLMRSILDPVSRNDASIIARFGTTAGVTVRTKPQPR